MIFNLIDFKRNFVGKFTKTDLETLEKIESLLKYKTFGDKEALELGAKLYEKAIDKGDIAIRITRESDQLPIFQLVMNSKKQRNIDFGEAKRNTVLKTGHCSMWAIIKEIVDGGLDDLFTEDSDCLPAGGGFPIYVGDDLVATLFVSGLHEGLDQILIVESLSEILNQEIPTYQGLII